MFIRRIVMRLIHSTSRVVSRAVVSLVLMAGGTFLVVASVGCNRDSAVDRADEAAVSSPIGVSPQSPTPPQPASFRLTDVTSDWGVDFVYRNGEDQAQYTILESLGGGVAVIDFDRDGRPDLFAPGGGSFENETTYGLPGELFRNIDGVRMVAVGAAAGEGFPSRVYSHGAFVADYNNDGFSDILVTGYGGLQLWQNQGDGTFMEVHESVGLDDQKWSSAAAWGDFNNDGALDVYVAHYVDWSFQNHPFCRGRTAEERDICPPREYSGLPDSLFLSNGDGTFRDVTQEWGLRGDGKGLGVVAADFDGNGHVDIYVANDTVNNFLYSNDGSGNLRETANVAGVATDRVGVPNGSMGVDLLDYNGSGRPDIWVTNYEREDFALYRNEGRGAFLHVSDIAGLNVLGGLFVGFGTVCADMDLSGPEDILVNNGHVILYPTASPRAQLPLALVGDNQRFRRVMFEDDNYMMQPHEGRGLALADIDGDGDLDAIFSNLNAPLAILRNDVTSPANWLQVRLVGTRSARDAIGATVVASVQGVDRLRIRKGGGSYMSTSQEALAWGLGDAKTVDRLTIRWPSGTETVLENVPANQTLVLVEPVDG